MPTSAADKRLIEVPADVWAALRLKPGAPVHWEIRGDEAVVRAGEGSPKRRTTVAEVAGLLAPKLKGRKVDWNAAAKKPPTTSQMRAAAKKAAATRFLRSSKNVA